MKLFTQNSLSQDLNLLFNSNFGAMLYKTFPPDINNMRPIGIRGGWSRATGTIAARVNRNILAKYFWPINVGIGVPGGANYIVHTLTAEIERYVSRSPADLLTHLPT